MYLQAMPPQVDQAAAGQIDHPPPGQILDPHDPPQPIGVCDGRPSPKRTPFYRTR